jgi:hypothetical protein
VEISGDKDSLASSPLFGYFPRGCLLKISSLNESLAPLQASCVRQPRALYKNDFGKLISCLPLGEMEMLWEILRTFYNPRVIMQEIKIAPLHIYCSLNFLPLGKCT